MLVDGCRAECRNELLWCSTARHVGAKVACVDKNGWPCIFTALVRAKKKLVYRVDAQSRLPAPAGSVNPTGLGADDHNPVKQLLEGEPEFCPPARIRRGKPRLDEVAVEITRPAGD